MILFAVISFYPNKEKFPMSQQNIIELVKTHLFRKKHPNFKPRYKDQKFLIHQLKKLSIKMKSAYEILKSDIVLIKEAENNPLILEFDTLYLFLEDQRDSNKEIKQEAYELLEKFLKIDKESSFITKQSFECIEFLKFFLEATKSLTNNNEDKIIKLHEKYQKLTNAKISMHYLFKHIKCKYKKIQRKKKQEVRRQSINNIRNSNFSQAFANNFMHPAGHQRNYSKEGSDVLYRNQSNQNYKNQNCFPSQIMQNSITPSTVINMGQQTPSKFCPSFIKSTPQNFGQFGNQFPGQIERLQQNNQQEQFMKIVSQFKNNKECQLCGCQMSQKKSHKNSKFCSKCGEGFHISCLVTKKKITINALNGKWDCWQCDPNCQRQMIQPNQQQQMALQQNFLQLMQQQMLKQYIANQNGNQMKIAPNDQQLLNQKNILNQKDNYKNLNVTQNIRQNHQRSSLNRQQYQQ